VGAVKRTAAPMPVKANFMPELYFFIFIIKQFSQMPVNTNAITIKRVL